MKFDPIYFVKFSFTGEQVRRNLANALRDLEIASKDEFLEVKFNYTYSAFIKSAIALLSAQGWKVRSAAGHHVKLIEKMSEILHDEEVAAIGNVMRAKRNLDLYAGGVEITEKECREFFCFVEKIIDKVKKEISIGDNREGHKG